MRLDALYPPHPNYIGRQGKNEAWCHSIRQRDEWPARM